MSHLARHKLGCLAPSSHLLAHVFDPVNRAPQRLGHNLGLLQAVHRLTLVVVVVQLLQLRGERGQERREGDGAMDPRSACIQLPSATQCRRRSHFGWATICQTCKPHTRHPRGKADANAERLLFVQSPLTQVMRWAVVRPVCPAPRVRVSNTTTFLPARVQGRAAGRVLSVLCCFRQNRVQVSPCLARCQHRVSTPIGVL